MSWAIGGLSPNTTYHFRAVAQNSAGTSYGSDRTFTTNPLSTPPTVTTATYQIISSSSAQLLGTVNPNGLSTTGWFQWGTTTSYGNTTGAESLGSGTSVIQMTHTISGLSPNTTYHFRAVAQNSAGTSYGADMSFTTPPPAVVPPTVTTETATSVTSSSATLNGTVNPNGAPTTGWFQWGTTTSYGNTSPTFSGGSGTSPVPMSWIITGLSPNTSYHFRAVAQNSAGTSYGSDRTFTTLTGGKIVTVANTGGYGLCLRSTSKYYDTCSGSPNYITGLPEGTQMTVIGGPVQADGYTWWNITGTPGTGWSAVGEWLTPAPQVGITVSVTYTGGYGLRLRNGAGLSYSVITTLPEGTQMTVFGGPIQADGYTWWAIQGYVGGTLYTGWSAVGNWLVPNPRY
jgi:hypothetical protein